MKKLHLHDLYLCNTLNQENAVLTVNRWETTQRHFWKMQMKLEFILGTLK